MSIILILLSIWTIFFIFLKFFEALTSGKLSKHLTNKNITLKFGYISIDTTKFNERIQILGHTRRKLFVPWFSIGVIFGFIGLILSLFLLFSNLITTTPELSTTGILGHSYARIPFFGATPRFIPQSLWIWFTPTDHKPYSVILPKGPPSLSELVARLSVVSWHLDLPKHDVDRDSKKVHGFRKKGDKGCGNHGEPHDKFRDATGHFYAVNNKALRNLTLRHHLRRVRKSKGRGRARGQRKGTGRKNGGRGRRGLNLDGDGDGDNDNTNIRPHPHQRKRRLQVHLFNIPLLNSSVNHQRQHHGRHLLAMPPPFPPPPVPPPHLSDGEGLDPPSRRDMEQLKNNQTSPSVPSINNRRLNNKLTPLVPGVTVPLGDLPYMLVAILVAAIVHELGHGLAACAEYGGIYGIGAFIVLILPGAYVRLNGIEDMSTKSKLRVYCAGAWHNMITALFAMFIVQTLPFFMSPLFHTSNSGALIVDVPIVSPFYGNLKEGDIIMKIGSYNVHDGGNGFRDVIQKIHVSNYSIGFCVGVDELKKSERKSSKCCVDDSKGSHKDIDDSDDGECYTISGLVSREICVNPYKLTFNSTCKTSIDCRKISIKNKKSTCVIPKLRDQKQLIDIVAMKKETEGNVHYFYEGYPVILGTSLSVSSYIPRFWKYIPLNMLKIISKLDIPNRIERFLQYFSSISLGLSLMNMAPVLYLDGESTIELYMKIIFGKYIKYKKIKRIRAFILLSGSMLLILNLMSSLLFIDKG